jgi:hypothetical protein
MHQYIASKQRSGAAGNPIVHFDIQRWADMVMLWTLGPPELKNVAPKTANLTTGASQLDLHALAHRHSLLQRFRVRTVGSV